MNKKAVENLKYRTKLKTTKPWYESYRGARYRCKNEAHEAYHRYGGRGIMFLLTEEEMNKLWIRDNAVKMEQPSIDRVDNDGNYEYENCRFIERGDNSRRGKYKKVMQLSLKSKVIAFYDSMSEASSSTGISRSNIGQVTLGKRKTAGGFKWKLSNEIPAINERIRG